MKVVFDASVVLAILKEELGGDVGEKYLPNALIPIVNFAEVASCLGRENPPRSSLERSVRLFEKHVVPLDIKTSFEAGFIAGKTKHLGLSLGNRVCLTYGMVNKLLVYTAEKRWKEVDLPVEVRMIREFIPFPCFSGTRRKQQEPPYFLGGFLEQILTRCDHFYSLSCMAA
ncbi:MAG: type II toxin-antitoxin system VapC family toxin [Leptolyngbya sp. SIO1D8]|nr:type II toxin-antitoxin system VapC family toxin [Leptolyngbya sp. SIO1D8]